MKRIILSVIALSSMLFLACGVKASPINKNSVANQVKAVYQYIDDARRYYLETPPEQIVEGKWQPVDARFATKEWQDVRNQVDAIDRECECGGFFDFGDSGPLDPWRYDCFEGTVNVENIKVTMQDGGDARVDFLIKDFTTITPVPMQWIMRVEDGQWRVANIIFVKDGNLNLLNAMKEYVANGGNDAQN